MEMNLGVILDTLLSLEAQIRVVATSSFFYL